MNLRQILLIVRLRWWVVLLVTTVIVVATYAVSVRLPKQFSTEATLLLDVKADPLVATFMPAVATPAYMATQIEIMRSDRVASRVVQMLGLTSDPAMLAQWRRDTKERIPADVFFGGELLKGLAVDNVRGSNVLSVGFTGPDPKFTTAAANAFARAYIDLSIELRVEPAKQYASFFDERLKSLRAEYEAAQSRLSEFQQKKGIVVSDERLDQETARLNALMTQLASAQADRADTSTRQRNTGTDTSPDVQQSPVVQSLKEELGRSEAKMSEISATFGANHPQRVQLEAHIAELRQQLSSEMRRVSGTTATASRQSGQKVGELQAMIDAQKRSLLAFRAERDEITVLLKDVETAQKAYESVSQRRSQVSLESQSEQAAARILGLAREPLFPSKPKIRVNVAMALVLGLGLGVGLVLGLELLDPRVRSEDDLLVAEGVPVLAVLSPLPAINRFGGQRRALPRPARRNTPPRLPFDGESEVAP